MNEKKLIIPDINEIEDFFITKSDTKDSLLIVLKNGEKIELQISTNIKELYDTLSMDKDESVSKLLERLVDWAKQELENLNLNSDSEVKELYDIPSMDEDESVSNFLERLIQELENPDLNSDSEIKEGLNSSLFELMEIQKLFKIIDANAKGLLNTNQKSIGPNRESNETYSRSDIIPKERIKNNLETLDKLFKLFQRATFSKDDPRSWHELNDDEKRVLDALLKEPIESQPEAEEDEDPTYQIMISDKNEQLQQIGIKQELDNLFGIGVPNRRFEEFYAYKQDVALSKETSEILDISNKIYKKLVIIGLYYKDELYIQTSSGPKIFTGPECIDDSIDGNIYYKDHQEKYGGEQRYRFIMDSHGQKKDTYIPITDIKIADLTYGSMSEVICLLSKKGIAPAFSVILSNGLLPGLGEFKNKPKEVDEQENKEIEEI